MRNFDLGIGEHISIEKGPRKRSELERFVPRESSVINTNFRPPQFRHMDEDGVVTRGEWTEARKRADGARPEVRSSTGGKIQQTIKGSEQAEDI